MQTWLLIFIIFGSILAVILALIIGFSIKEIVMLRRLAKEVKKAMNCPDYYEPLSKD